MEALLIYFAKMIVCSGVTFLYYKLSLKDKTFHHYNRFYLLSAIVISILLPLVKVEYFTIEVSNNIYILLSKVQSYNNNNSINNDNIYFTIILTSLGLVSLYFLGKFIYGISRIQHLKNQFQKESFEGVNFYQTNLSEAPFSYFKNLFWKNTILINSEVGKQILKHEMVHIEQKHSIDKILVEVVTSIFWFNPFFHIIKKEISLIHEYLADKKAVKNSDTKAFAQMLLASHFSGNSLPATSPFLSSTLKKRIKMLQKPKTKFGYARRIFALPVLFTVAFAYMVNAKNKEIKETNTEINKAVAEIKKDTISPAKTETEKLIRIQEAKLSKASEKVNNQSEKLKVISEKAKEKAVELRKIAKEQGEKSYEFELKAKELKQLSNEMDKFVDIDKQYQADFDELLAKRNKLLADKDGSFILKDLSLKRVFPDGENYSIKVHGDDVNIINLEKIFDTKEFKEKSILDVDKIKALKSTYKSQYLKEIFNKADKVYVNGNLVLSPDISKKLAETGYQVLNSEYDRNINSLLNKKTNLSKKELKKLEKLKKERIDAEKKLQEIKKQQRELQGNPWMISVDAHEKPKYTASATYVESKNSNTDFITKKLPEVISSKGLSINKLYINGKDAFNTNTKFIIDGKESSRKDMDAIKADNIRDMSIKKNNVNGVESNEIIINTKKKKTEIY